MNFFKNKTNVITYTVNKAVDSNMYLSVQNGEIVINAPWYASNNQIQRVIEEKKNWIKEKLQEHEIKQSKKVKLLGEEYTIKAECKNTKAPELVIEDKNIVITLPNKYKKIQNNEIIKILIDKMYDMVATREIEKAMEEVRIMLGLAPEDYEIKKLTKEIARCNNLENKITITPDIVKYSKQAIKYVVLHEFCHLQYKNHTKSFYNMVETYMPNYEKIAEELNGLKY